MACRNTHERYGSVTKFFHWLIFVLFLIQIIVGVSMSRIGNEIIQGRFYTFHKSVGLLILFVMILFIFWSLINPKPHWSISMTKWERVAAKTVHFALYLLLFLMPISGWLLSTAAGHPPNFFWLVEIPMPGIGINKAVVTAAANIHLILAWVTSVSRCS
ncbi:cytochrome b [Candidiatus Paracoxiella cheracis]|uniref:cytochrome b n=1 Tax=Candidiatus Paracoxiella cheracis TaxID=3405120 RepID=UPI003BF5D217